MADLEINQKKNRNEWHLKEKTSDALLKQIIYRSIFV